MFDIYHQLTDEESKLIQEVFDARNELKKLKDTRFIYQKDLEMLRDDDKGRIGVIIVMAIPAVLCWFFFLGDLFIILNGRMNTMLIAISVASLAPFLAIGFTIFFFVSLRKHLLVYSKNPRYMEKAKKANVQNQEAYRIDIARKYADVSTKITDMEAHLKVLEEELERLEAKSRSEESNNTEAVKSNGNGNEKKESGESNR